MSAGQFLRFVVLPPDYEGDAPKGHHVFRSRTYGVWFILRGFLVDGDTGQAVAAIKKQLRIYPLSRAGNPPAMAFINASGREFGIRFLSDNTKAK